MRRNTLLEWAAISFIAPKIGCTPETLKLLGSGRLKRSQGIRPGMTSAERDRMKELELREPKACAVPTKSYAGVLLFSPKRSSTACGSNGRLYRRTQDRLRSRADLPNTSDRFVDILAKESVVKWTQINVRLE